MVRLALLTLAVTVGGCAIEPIPVIQRTAPPPALVPGDPDESAYIASDFVLDLMPGEGVGYAITYSAGGWWQVRWSCDSLVSGYACMFDGTVLASVDDQLTDLTATDPVLEGIAWYASEDQGEINFSAMATTTTEGFDFQATPGAKVTFDLLVDGLQYWQFVFFPSHDPASIEGPYGASPYYLPVTLLPTEP